MITTSVALDSLLEVIQAETYLMLHSTDIKVDASECIVKGNRLPQHRKGRRASHLQMKVDFTTPVAETLFGSAKGLRTGGET